MSLKSSTFVVLSLVMALALFGCGHSKQAMKGEKGVTQPVATKAQPAPEKQAAVSAPSAKQAISQVALLDVHFDFDRYVIRPQDAAVLKKDYGWFKSNPAKKIKIEGYCDERGSVEYNLALGQKRADAAKSYLEGLGVAGNLLDTVSYGKENPIDPGHNETAWAKNRRAHLNAAK